MLENVLLVLALNAVSAPLAASGIYSGSISSSWTGNQTIPDYNASGIAFAFSVSPSTPLRISAMTVDLNISGGWNGDLYAYISHDGGFAVLLNRVGRSVQNPAGYSAAGFNISLSDAFPIDIHNFAGDPVAGNFAPDGRNVNPFGTLDTDPRTATLSQFDGLDPSGSWTIFFADLSPLAASSLQSWAVEIQVVDVPEPPTELVGPAAALAGIGLRCLRKEQPARSTR